MRTKTDGYEIFYADPPWPHDFCRSATRRVTNHYRVMNLEDILRVVEGFPVASNAALYLWATAPKLPEALATVEAWGFKYKTCAAWDKERIGMGYWFRGQHELLLVGTRGKFSPPEPEFRRGSVIRSPRGRHSAKPDVVREMIAEQFPGRRKIELFARWPGDSEWDTWGDQASAEAPTSGNSEASSREQISRRSG